MNNIFKILYIDFYYFIQNITLKKDNKIKYLNIKNEIELKNYLSNKLKNNTNHIDIACWSRGQRKYAKFHKHNDCWTVFGINLYSKDYSTNELIGFLKPKYFHNVDFSLIIKELKQELRAKKIERIKQIK